MKKKRKLNATSHAFNGSQSKSSSDHGRRRRKNIVKKVQIYSTTRKEMQLTTFYKPIRRLV